MALKRLKQLLEYYGNRGSLYPYGSKLFTKNQIRYLFDRIDHYRYPEKTMVSEIQHSMKKSVQEWFTLAMMKDNRNLSKEDLAKLQDGASMVRYGKLNFQARHYYHLAEFIKDTSFPGTPKRIFFKYIIGDILDNAQSLDNFNLKSWNKYIPD